MWICLNEEFQIMIMPLKYLQNLKAIIHDPAWWPVPTMWTYASKTRLHSGQCPLYGYMVKSHEMDSLWGFVRNSGGHIIT